MKKKRAGRPSIIDKHADELVKLVRSGVSFADACQYRGVGESTFYNWKVKGEEQKSGKYREFLDRITQAEIEAKIRKINVVERASVNDPKLALELLARKYPKEWGRKDRWEHEVVGGDKPLNIKVEWNKE